MSPRHASASREAPHHVAGAMNHHQQFSGLVTAPRPPHRHRLPEIAAEVRADGMEEPLEKERRPKDTSTLLFFLLTLLLFPIISFFFARRLEPLGRTGWEQRGWHWAHSKIFLIVVFFLPYHRGRKAERLIFFVLLFFLLLSSFLLLASLLFLVICLLRKEV